MFARLCFQAGVLAYQVLVVAVNAVVARIEHGLAQRGIVEEKATTKIVNSLFCFRQKLVGDERYVITCLAKQFGKEGIVAPFASLAHIVERENMFENVAGKVPRRHHIVEFHQLSATFAAYLSWRCGLNIAVLLRVMFAKTLADNQHDVRTGVCAAVYLCLVGSNNKLVYLLRSQYVGIDREGQSVHGVVGFAMSLLGKRMFHFAYAPACHQFP